MTSLVVATEPTSLVGVEDQCSAVEAWAETETNIAAIRDAGNKLAAIDHYLSLTSTKGRARVAAAQRRLEVRIGDLLGPAPTPQESGGWKGSGATEASAIPKDQRSEFRRMAEHPEVVEQVIATSTDEAPASRRQVAQAIKATKPAITPRRSPLPEQADRAGWEFRRSVERLVRIHDDDRFAANREQVAAALRGHLTYAAEVLTDLLAAFDTDPTEDR